MEDVNITRGYEQLFNEGKKIIPVGRSKVPKVKEWQIRDFTIDDIVKNIRDGGNVGWQLGEGDLVIDVDIRNHGDKSFVRLCEDTGITMDMVNVITAGNGYHLYFKHNFEYIHKSLRDYEGIELFSNSSNMFVVLPPSKIDGKSYSWSERNCHQSELPPKLHDLIESNNNLYKRANKLDKEGRVKRENNWVSKQKVVEMLTNIGNEDLHYDNWLEIGMCLYDWDKDYGLDLWITWSKLSAKHSDGVCERKWNSFEKMTEKTVGSLFYHDKEATIKRRKKLIDKYHNQLLNVDDTFLQCNLLPEIRKTELTNIERERLVNAFIKRYLKEEHGNVRISKPDARSELAYIKDEKNNELKIPAWCENIFYLKNRKGFIDITKSQITMKTEAFNAEYGKYIPAGEKFGSKANAHKFVFDHGFVKMIDNEVYQPETPDRIITENNITSLNCFDHDSIPKTKKREDMTDDDYKNVDFFKKHLRLLAGDEEYAVILEQWLAFQVQHMGQKLRWLPLIHGIQGIGKSMVGQFIAGVLGDRNVSTINSDELRSKWNGWSVGYLLIVLEEINLLGKTAADIERRIKPIITDDNITVIRKYCETTKMANKTNYIGFTNDKTAIKLTADDRRWFVLSSPVKSKADLEERVGMKYNDYFNHLAYIIRCETAVFRRWLLDYPISKEFKENTTAPQTRYKELLIVNTSYSSEENSMLDDLIKEGGKGYNERYIISNFLFNAYEEKHLEGFNALSPIKKSTMLKELGYLKVDKKFHVDGNTLNVWVKNSSDLDNLKENIKRTIRGEELVPEE